LRRFIQPKPSSYVCAVHTQVSRAVLESALGPGDLWHGVISSWNNHRKNKDVAEVKFDIKNQQQPLRAIA
jgi:hypothetical protein